MEPRGALRNLLAKPGYTIVPGAFDPLSARLVEVEGFSAIYLTGGGFSRANALPDLGFMTLTEVAAWISRVVDVVEIPVIADADTGYGNAINVIRTVREFEKTGVAGFHLEDQVTPKRCGHYEGKAVVSVTEMVGKIAAAVDTRRDADMVVIARTDARAVEGLSAAIDRVNAYLVAGADVGFVDAPHSVEELATIARQIRGPTLVNIFRGGKTLPVGARELERMGFKLGIYPSQTQRGAIAAIKKVLACLHTDGDTDRVEHELATFADREQAVSASHWHALEAKYLAGDFSHVADPSSRRQHAAPAQS